MRERHRFSLSMPVALLMLCSSADALASDMAAIGAGTFLIVAWMAMWALCAVVSVVVARRRQRRSSPGALWYLWVPVETGVGTIVGAAMLAYSGIDPLNRFFLYALAVPLAAWGLAHLLHREREPTFRYRGGRRS
jgi:hypothetical protein